MTTRGLIFAIFVVLCGVAFSAASLEQSDADLTDVDRTYGRSRCGYRRPYCRAASSYEVSNGQLNSNLAQKGYWVQYGRGQDCRDVVYTKWGWCHWYPECRGNSATCKNVNRCETEPSPGPGFDVSRRVEEAMDNLAKTGSTSVRTGYGHKHHSSRNCNKCEIQKKNCSPQAFVCYCPRRRHRHRSHRRRRY